MSASRKPVIVRKLTGEWYAGYTPANPDPAMVELDLLDDSGRRIRLTWAEVKWVCYVRELVSPSPGPPSGHPERLLRRKFSTRPRIPGLWLSLMLADSDQLEGIAANDRSLIEGAGLLLIPPDTRSNTQRIFIPHTAIQSFTVLGVLNPGQATVRKPAPQPELFEPLEEPA